MILFLIFFDMPVKPRMAKFPTSTWVFCSYEARSGSDILSHLRPFTTLIRHLTTSPLPLSSSLSRLTLGSPVYQQGAWPSSTLLAKNQSLLNKNREVPEFSKLEFQPSPEIFARKFLFWLSKVLDFARTCLLKTRASSIKLGDYWISKIWPSPEMFLRRKNLIAGPLLLMNHNILFVFHEHF